MTADNVFCPALFHASKQRQKKYIKKKRLKMM